MGCGFEWVPETSQWERNETHKNSPLQLDLYLQTLRGQEFTFVVQIIFFSLLGIKNGLILLATDNQPHP